MASGQVHGDRKPSVEMGSEEGKEITEVYERLAVGRHNFAIRTQFFNQKGAFSHMLLNFSTY